MGGRRPGFSNPLLPSGSMIELLSQMFAHQAGKPWTTTRTFAMKIRTGRYSKIQDGEDVDVLMSSAIGYAAAVHGDILLTI